MGLIFNGNGDVIKAVDGSLTVEGIDLGGSTNINAGIVTGTSANFTGAVSVGGVLTYEDVKNVDSVGVVTARAGIVAQSDVKFANQSIDNAVNWGKVSNILQVRDGTKITFGNANDMQLSHNGSDSVISQSASGTGNLKILSGGAQSIECVQAGAVNIAHNGNTKLATTSTGVTVTGDITISDKIIHTGDTNTAIRFPANDTVSVETAGQQNVQVNGARVLLKSPSGTDTTVRLQHQGNSGYGDIILDRQVNAFIIDNDPSNASNNTSYFSVKNKGTENLRILHNGRVGIASAIATAPLNVQAETSTGHCVRLNQETTNKKASIYFQDATTTGSDSWIINENYDLTVYAGYGGKLNLGVYNKTGITVLSNGFVGIGTDNPVRKLHVEDDNAEIALYQSRRAAGSYVNYKLGANGAELGMLGSGAAILSGGADAADFGIRAVGDLCFSSGGHAEKARLDSDGRLRIGNTTQNQYTAADDLIVGSGSGDRGLTLYSGSSDAGVIAFSDGTSDTAYRSGQIIYDHSADAMDFRTNGNYIRLKITSGGQVQLPINGQELAWGASQQFRMFWENSEERMYLKGNGAYGIAFRVNNGNRMEISKTTGDIIMQGTSGRNFQWDNSEPSLYLTDNGTNSARLKIGSSGDLQMYHDVGSHLNFITCATNADLKVSTKTLQVFDYTGGTKKFETTNRGKVLSYHADTAAYGASNWARTGTGNQSNSSQASPEGSFQFQSNTGNGTMRFKSYIQATSANQTDMYIHLTNSGFYRITIEASHNSQGANVAMYLVYGLANMNAVIQQVTSSGNFSATTQNTHVNSHDTTLKISYSGSTNQGMRALVEQIGGF